MNYRKYIVETFKYWMRAPWLIRGYINKVERLYRFSDYELSRWKLERLQKIVNTAYRRSPFYRRLFNQAGFKPSMLRDLDDVKRIPMIDKEMVRANGDKMRTLPRWVLVPNHTSGTTGTPLTVWESWAALWREQAYLYVYRRRCGFTYGEPLVSLRGNLDRNDTHLKIHASNTLYLSTYNVNAANASLYHTLICEHKPKAIEGYPSSLYQLALLFRDAGLRACIPVAFTSSETLLPDQRQLIEQMLGTRIFDHFGTTERTIMLGERLDHRGYFEMPGYGHYEYLDDGEITTSLINRAFPLIRYRGYDILEFEDDPEGSSRRVIKVVGRREDFIECKDGTLMKRLDFMAKSARNIRYSQLLQTADGVLHIRIVPDHGYTDADGLAMLEAMYLRTGRDNIDAVVEVIDEDQLIRSRSGKFRFIVKETR